MTDRIKYGFKNQNKGFFVLTNFEKEGYYYYEKIQDFRFNRRWGKMFKPGSSWLDFNNIRFYSSINRPTYWSFYIYQENNTTCFERHDSTFEYRIYSLEQKQTVFRKRVYWDNPKVEVPTEPTPSQQNTTSSSLTNTNKSQVFASKIVENAIAKNLHLYEQINDKIDFKNILIDHYSDLVDEQGSKNIDTFVNDSKRLFVNVIKSQELYTYLKNILNKDFLIETFPHILQYVDRINFQEVINESLGIIYNQIVDYSFEDLLIEIENILNHHIDSLQELDFKKELNKYDINYIITAYSEKIKPIANKEDLLILLEKEIESAKQFCPNKKSFFERIEKSISIFAQKDFFINTYGSDDITILLNDQKKKLFDCPQLTKLTEIETKEYSLYQQLLEKINVELYYKNSVKPKPAFAYISKFIDNLNKIKKLALDNNLMKLVNNRFVFVSFDKIQEFIELLKVTIRN